MNEGQEGSWKGIFIFASYCHGFASTFLDNQSGFDSIAGFKYEVIFNDDYNQLPEARRRFKEWGFAQKAYVLDEAYYGRFGDRRVKNKRVLEDFKMTSQDLTVMLDGEFVKDQSWSNDYDYMIGALYIIADPRGKATAVTYSATPQQIKDHIASHSHK